MKTLEERIKKHEGYMVKPYTDTLGFLTGGYGHKILPGEEIPTDQEGWEKLFRDSSNFHFLSNGNRLNFTMSPEVFFLYRFTQ